MERYLWTGFGYAIVVPVPPVRGSEVQRIDLAYNVGAVQNQEALLVDRAALEGLVQLSIARVFFVPQEAAGTGQSEPDVLRHDAQLGAWPDVVAALCSASWPTSAHADSDPRADPAGSVDPRLDLLKVLHSGLLVDLLALLAVA